MQSLLQNYEEPFIIYTENILRRTAAAVRIQQNWRKFLIRKNQTFSIYEEMKKTRAILRIQRFWRDRVFYHRLSFQNSMTHELKLFQSNSILLRKQVYMKVNDIISTHKKMPLYKKLAIMCHRDKNTVWTEWAYKKSTFSPHLRRNFFNNQQADYEGSMMADGFSVIHSGAEITEVSFN